MEQQGKTPEQASQYPKVEEWVMRIFLKIQMHQQEIRTTGQHITVHDIANIVARNIDTQILTAIAMAVILDPVDTTQWKKITTPNPNNVLELTKTVTYIIDRAFQKKNERWNKRWEKGVMYVIQKLAEEIIEFTAVEASYACDYIDAPEFETTRTMYDLILQAKMNVRQGMRKIYAPLQTNLKRRRGHDV